MLGEVIDACGAMLEFQHYLRERREARRALERGTTGRVRRCYLMRPDMSAAREWSGHHNGSLPFAAYRYGVPTLTTIAISGFES